MKRASARSATVSTAASTTEAGGLPPARAWTSVAQMVLRCWVNTGRGTGNHGFFGGLVSVLVASLNNSAEVLRGRAGCGFEAGGGRNDGRTKAGIFGGFAFHASISRPSPRQMRYEKLRPRAIAFPPPRGHGAPGPTSNPADVR